MLEKILGDITEMSKDHFVQVAAVFTILKLVRCLKMYFKYVFKNSIYTSIFAVPTREKIGLRA